jgi:hypothetical protein
MRLRSSHRVLDENQVEGQLVAMRLHMVLNDDRATTTLDQLENGVRDRSLMQGSLCATLSTSRQGQPIGRADSSSQPWTWIGLTNGN